MENWPTETQVEPQSLLPPLLPHKEDFSVSRGVPGKKCGTILLTAEELSNCRVSKGHMLDPQGSLLSPNSL